MIPFDDSLDDDIRFDRLVDGELIAAERRQLLASLDDEPGAWRRCAMAFLEAQAWRQSMHGIQLSSDPTHDVEARPDVVDRAPIAAAAIRDELGRTERNLRRTSLVGLILAMAGCFIVAFLLGTEFRRRATTVQPAAESLAASQNTHPANTHPANTEQAITPQDGEVPVALDEVTPWGEATLLVDDEGGQEVDVPVFDLDADARQVLLENSTAALDDLVYDLRQRGFEVRQDVRWSPVDMGGGQQMYVPVGDFEITPVSRQVIP